MIKKWYEHSQRFLRERDIGEIVGRRVVYFIPETHKIKEIKEGNRSNNDGPHMTLQGVGGRYGIYHALVPETREDFETYIQILEEEIAEIKERIQCLTESNIDQLDEKGFVIWKLMREIETEKDKDKLRKLLSNAVKE